MIRLQRKPFGTALILMFALATIGMAQTSTFPYPVGIIVKAPTPGTGLAGTVSAAAGSMNLVTTFVAIGNFADQSRLTATVSGTLQVLFDGLVDAPGIFNPRARRNAPWIYPLTTGNNGSPTSIPSNNQVSAVLTDPYGNTYSVQTTSFITGIQQSGDTNTVTITGNFDPTLPTAVYLGFWPIPFAPEHVSASSTKITIDLTRELIGGFAPGLYPVTVKNGSQCDSALLPFRSAVPQ